MHRVHSAKQNHVSLLINYVKQTPNKEEKEDTYHILVGFTLKKKRREKPHAKNTAVKETNEYLEELILAGKDFSGNACSRNAACTQHV